MLIIHGHGVPLHLQGNVPTIGPSHRRGIRVPGTGAFRRPRRDRSAAGAGRGDRPGVSGMGMAEGEAEDHPALLAGGVQCSGA